MNMLVRFLSFGIVFGCWWCPRQGLATIVPPPSLRINEWMTVNLSFPDENGETGAWLEVYNAGNSAVNLAGWHLTDNLDKPEQWTFPAGIALPAGGFILLWADGKNRASHTNFRLNENGGLIGLFEPGGALRDLVQYGALPAEVSQGRIPDGAAAIGILLNATPGAANSEAVLQVTASAQVALSPTGAVWRYLDRGENLGATWRETGYNDANWASGRAQLGFGDNDEATIISGGSAAQHNTTTYFRRAFFVTNAPLYTNLTLRLLRDDGAVVYLNGSEIRRDNLPAGQLISYSTLALSDVDGPDENNFFATTLGQGRLGSGMNVLAVEVHQSASASFDLSFDLELLASGESLPGVVTRPGFISVPPGSCVELKAPAVRAGIRLQWLRNNQILPGETNPTLRLCGIQAADGGAYGLLMTGLDGQSAVLNPTDVVIDAPTAPISADTFQAGMQLFGPGGVVQGNNAEATGQTGEPFHNGVAGGRSMWFHWTAPASGIATFDTRGSTIDTLLAVYTGLSVSNLMAIASDDERGGFSTATVTFNVQANLTYHIAVDGFEGTGGYFNLRWALENTPLSIPTILAEPEAETVPLGGSAMFSVGVMQPGATYQWLRNGRIIPNEVSDHLNIPNVTSDVLGNYSVRVGNTFGKFVESAAAGLFLGECARFYQRPYAFLQPCAGNLRGLSFAPAGFGGSTNPPSAGVPGAIQLGGFLYGEASYTPSTGTYFICEGTTILSPQFYDLQVTDDGFLRLDTCGSDFPAVLALYHKAPVRHLEPTYRIACDLTSAALGHPAMVTAQVTGGVYTVIVGRLTSFSSESTIRINERLGPSCFLASQGVAPIVLKVNTNRSEWAAEPFTSFRWFKNDVPLTSTAGPTLSVGNPGPGLQATDVGTYTLIMTNLARRVIREAADVIVTNVPSANFYRLRGGYSNDGGLQRMELEARCNRPLWLESSASVIDTPISWTPLDRWVTNYAVVFLECDEPLQTQRYFRQRILAP